jgi:hypothetical protein
MEQKIATPAQRAALAKGEWVNAARVATGSDEDVWQRWYLPPKTSPMTREWTGATSYPRLAHVEHWRHWWEWRLFTDVNVDVSADDGLCGSMAPSYEEARADADEVRGLLVLPIHLGRTAIHHMLRPYMEHEEVRTFVELGANPAKYPEELANAAERLDRIASLGRRRFSRGRRVLTEAEAAAWRHARRAYGFTQALSSMEHSATAAKHEKILGAALNDPSTVVRLTEDELRDMKYILKFAYRGERDARYHNLVTVLDYFHYNPHLRIK